MNSDSDYEYITTYSEDERISLYLTEKRTVEELQAKQKDEERRKLFEEYYDKHKNDPDSVFQLDGLSFLTFRNNKVKFIFQPYKAACLSPKIMFYCTLRYRNNYWILKRNTFPVNCKRKIYDNFYLKRGFLISGDSDEKTLMKLISAIRCIYEILVRWSEEQDIWRRRKYKDYQNGMDIILDSDDEELFLSKTEIEEIHRKREAVLQRMLPPHSARRPRLRGRRY